MPSGPRAAHSEGGVTLSPELFSPSVPMCLALGASRLGLSALKGSPVAPGSGTATGQWALSFQLVTGHWWQTKALAHPGWEILRTQKSSVEILTDGNAEVEALEMTVRQTQTRCLIHPDLPLLCG